MKVGRNLRVSAYGAIAIVCAATLSFAQNYQGEVTIPDEVLDSPISSFQSYMGFDVAVDGNWAIVGQPLWDRGNGPTAVRDNILLNGSVGAAHLFERTAAGWVLRQTLEPQGIPGDSRAGVTVAIEGATAFVGAPNQYIDVGTQGAVHVYDLVNGVWQYSQRLEARPGTLTLGYSIAVDGDSLLISAPFDDGLSNNHGFVEYFERVAGDWVRMQVFTDPFIPSFGQEVLFGRSLALEGTTAVVGVKGYNTGTYVEQVLIYEHTSVGWVKVENLIEAVSNLRNNYGTSVALEGDTLVVGAPQMFGDLPARSGFATIYERDRMGIWQFVQTIESSNPVVPTVVNTDGFGASVAINEGKVLIGANFANYEASDPSHSGQAFLFEKDSTGVWEETFVFRASENFATTGSFGGSVAISENYAIVGDHIGVDSLGIATGASFAFELPKGNVGCLGPANSTGQPGGLRITGNRNLAAGILTARGKGMPIGQAALLLGSRQSGFIATPGGSLGNLCLGGRIGRLGVAVADQRGRLELHLNPSALAMNPPVPILPGETWHFQLWYRDQHIGATSNLTNSIVVDF